MTRKVKTMKYLVIRLVPDRLGTYSAQSFYELRDKEPELDELQKWCGGMIQVIPNWDKHGNMSCTAYCDEEGLYKNYAYNTEATNLWRRALTAISADWDESMAHLVGPVVLVCQLP